MNVREMMEWLNECNPESEVVLAQAVGSKGKERMVFTALDSFTESDGMAMLT